MIGSVRGKVILKDGLHLLVDVNGVGYKILVSEKIRAKTNIDSQVFLYTYAHIRDDAFDLFGFLDILDLKLFENLIGVSGVGPRTGMSILSFLTREEVINAVVKGDTSVFSGIPRLGTKNAQKIIIELKNKLGDTGTFNLNEIISSENDDIFTALESFGFTRREIADALKGIDQTAKTSEDKIRLALKFLGR